MIYFYRRQFKMRGVARKQLGVLDKTVKQLLAADYITVSQAVNQSVAAAATRYLVMDSLSPGSC